MKKNFNCGHSGKGKFCHRCAQVIDLMNRAQLEKEPNRREALNMSAAKLLNVPKKVGATMMPSDPVSL
jgi:hypothetical protein